MKPMEQLAFRGVFREYQQAILDRCGQYLKDRKIHIVAAPGSGKTILGLELIRRVGKPALILSPTVTIRQQWGERFAESFLPEGEPLADYLSTNLKEPGFLTSVTYQALHAAYSRTVLEEEGEEADESEDFGGFDLIDAVRAAGVGVVCLDEAHHLRSQWQRDLEAFVEKLGDGVTIIALTATPPYDSTREAWNRYVSLCGEIDEEIHVPQLVAEGTLCPHQDYIYFTYPTAREEGVLKSYRASVTACLETLFTTGVLSKALEESGILTQYRQKGEWILEHVKPVSALLSMARYGGAEIPRGLMRLISPRGRLPQFTLELGEQALQLILDEPEVFEKASAEARDLLVQHGLMERGRVRLFLDERAGKALVRSAGKLNGIEAIVQEEYRQLGGRLRMLILTDYIRRDKMSLIGSGASIDMMGAMPIFECVRRLDIPGLRIAVLSGSLVILPDEALNAAAELAEKRGVRFSVHRLGGTGYSEARFSGSNKHRVQVLTEIFQMGLIHVLVGTAALLGEGWDSPCINALILASFVGSFMLSNQMRGRAIRIDRSQPDKTANIWHLVTVETPVLPESGGVAQLMRLFQDNTVIQGEDFATVQRRFDCFMAPAYHRDAIESGIDRVDILKPPYTPEGIARINREMLALSGDRAAMAGRWRQTMANAVHPEVMEIRETPSKGLPMGFLFRNLLAEGMLAGGCAVLVQLMRQWWEQSARSPLQLAAAGLLAVLAAALLSRGMVRILRFISPKKTIQTLCGCILDAMKQAGEIESEQAAVWVRSDLEGTMIACALQGGTEHEKHRFAQAVAELLSSIDNPRYVLVKRFRLAGRDLYHYRESFACPSVLGGQKERAECFARLLSKRAGQFALVDTRSEAGRRQLLKCRRNSYINENERYITGKRTVDSSWQ